MGCAVRSQGPPGCQPHSEGGAGESMTWFVSLSTNLWFNHKICFPPPLWLLFLFLFSLVMGTRNILLSCLVDPHHPTYSHTKHSHGDKWQLTLCLVGQFIGSSGDYGKWQSTRLSKGSSLHSPMQPNSCSVKMNIQNGHIPLFFFPNKSCGRYWHFMQILSIFQCS